MGIMARDAELIESLIRDGHLPPGFSVCELGNQLYRAGGARIPSSDWYATLGASGYRSIDANGGATDFADLNWQLPGTLMQALGQFDLVTDFGTGEHIFNQAQVFETLHDLTKVGGLIVIDRPMQGWKDHCFYNLHPTLIFDLAAANDYQILTLEHRPERHGLLLLAVLKKTIEAPFMMPNQGKYKAMLAATETPKRVKRGDVLLDLVHRNGWKRGAEIGVLDGEAVFFKLLDTFRHLTMIAVDAWSETNKDYGDLTATGEAFRERARSYGAWAEVIHGPSADPETLAFVNDASLDFVFIDASHDYDSVKGDIAAWTPKVRAGGMVLGHDWNPERFPGVIDAVTEAFGAPNIKLYADHVWGVQV